jgi:hypothetical protein
LRGGAIHGHVDHQIEQRRRAAWLHRRPIAHTFAEMTKETSSFLDARDAAAPTIGLPADLERVEAAVADALNAAKLYDIGSYGWLDEYHEDPDFIGHAMWQLDQPLSRELQDAFGEQPVRQRPSERDKQVLIAGEDFCGMMRLARLSIGFAMLWRQHRPGNPIDDQSYFRLHDTDAVLKLAIASDRLRDVLVVACTGSSVAAYEKVDGKRRAYVVPFDTVRLLLESRGPVHPGADEAIGALPPLAVQIHANIKLRNKTVHEIASRMGHITRQQVDRLQARYEHAQQSKIRAPARMPEIRDWREAEREYRAELDSALKTICGWYALLTKASSYVFEVEYWSRVGTP